MNELMHFGIKGMRWGVRRSPEELGYSRRLSRKKVRDMSDQELQARINRIQKEKQYRELTASPITKFGKKVVEGVVVAAAIGTAKSMVAKQMVSKGNSIQQKVSDIVSYLSAGYPSINVKE